MSKRASEFQEKVMSHIYRGKEIFKPLNMGRIDDHVSCVREFIANIFFYTKGDTTLVIDAGYNYPRLKEKMGWLDSDPAKIKHIVITRQDTDHMGAAETDSDGLFRNAKLYIGEVENRCLIGEVRRKVIFGLYKLPMVKTDNERVLLKDGQVLDIGGIKVECFLATLEEKLRSRRLRPIIITGYTGWTDDLDFAFAHTDPVCNPWFKQKPHDPEAPMTAMMKRMIPRKGSEISRFQGRTENLGCDKMLRKQKKLTAALLCGLLGCLCFGAGDWLMLYGDTTHSGTLTWLTAGAAQIAPWRNSLAMALAFPGIILYAVALFAMAALLSDKKDRRRYQVLTAFSLTPWLCLHLFYIMILYGFAWMSRNGYSSAALPVSEAFYAHLAWLVLVSEALMLPPYFYWCWLLLKKRAKLPQWMALFNPLIFYGVLKLLTLLMPDSAFRPSGLHQWPDEREHGVVVWNNTDMEWLS